MKKLSNKNVEPLLERSFAPPYEFSLYGWSWAKNIGNFWKKTQWFGGGI